MVASGMLPPGIGITLPSFWLGALMIYGGWVWAKAKWNEVKPMLGVTDAVDYFPFIIAGILIVLFSIEHILAIFSGKTVEPAWE